MDSSAEQPSPDLPTLKRMARMRKLWQWLALLVASLLFACALELHAL
ncbi:AbrB family transcriptional regulator, partial [Mesorhizobium sp. M7A.F.Ca.US.007.01.1.1]